MITKQIAESIDSSVLCWLATVSADGMPNVSPKEAFVHDGDGKILVANIASPQTVRNIRAREEVCVSFINVFVQRGFKIEGKARILEAGDAGYDEQVAKLIAAIGTDFEILSVIEIDPVAASPIIAPSYRLFPESGELDRIRESLETYQVSQYQEQVEKSEPSE